MRNRLFNKALTTHNSGKQIQQKQPELLAPAGIFSAAFHAFCSGADAVYFGLKDFSARKGARNFTMEEVARLKTFSETLGKRIYAALNTVIREEELKAVASVLYDLQALRVDGVIIQDLGVLYLLHQWFPRLPIHASTQMAVHNAEGVEALKNFGVRRIILARELTIAELKKIREAHPDVELEVFIHGSLCYSVSGLCLASGMLLGRSGNRGECAQICRSWFSEELFESTTKANEGSSGSLEGYFFSSKDLALCKEVLELRKIGIDAFKIEGRLKSPEWVAAVTRYYRSILDRDTSFLSDPEEHPNSKNHLEQACWIFSRSLTKGYLSSSSGFPGLLDPRFPGHRGIPIGKVLAVEGNLFLLKPKRGLSVRDGLQFFRPQSGIRMEAVSFGIKKIHSESSPKPRRKWGRPILSCQRGQPVWIEAPEPPPLDTEIYLISTHADALPEAPDNIPRKKVPIELSVELTLPAGNPSAASQEATLLTIIINIVHNEQNASHSIEELLVWKGVVPVERARSGLRAEEVFTKFLSPPGDSFFQLARTSVNVPAQDVSAENAIGGSITPSIFIPPSRLKEIRRELYRQAEEAWTARKETHIEEILWDRRHSEESPTDRRMQKTQNEPQMEPIPSRDQIYRSVSGIPFITDGDLPQVKPLFHSVLPVPTLFLPLAPVLFQTEPYWERTAQFIHNYLGKEPEARIYLGLNNIGHIPFAWKFLEEERVRFFIDYGLYMANRFALRMVRNLVPRIDFYYPWAEEGVMVKKAPPAGSVKHFPLTNTVEASYFPMIPVGSYGKFQPPLFIGRACMYRSLPSDAACSDCPFPLTLRQGNRTFVLKSAKAGGSCLNLLFLEA